MKVALLLVIIDNKILLFKRSSKESDNSGKYGLVGGGIDDGETPEQALRREVKEEAGVTAPSFRKLRTYNIDGAEIHVFYTNEFNVGGIKLNDEHTEHKFFKYSELSSSNIISTNKKFVDDYNKMVDDEKKLNESVLRMKSIMGINELTVYRGIGNNMQYNNQNTENEGFLWVALDKSLAANYASYDSNSREHNIQTLDIQQPKNPFKFPFKINVHLKGSDMTNQLRLVRDQKYKHKEINIYDYKILTDIINEYGQAAGDNLEAFHTKMDKPGASIKLAKVLSHMGYDAVQVDTDQGITYGIIKI
jgi:ADP-ribose pyrophosphatase YjhB (NUDIX family)